jgi:hypothetical protein
MSTYHMDGEIGKDNNEGTSKIHPWQIIDRVNSARL